MMQVSEFDLLKKHRRIGIYGGSFDPVHRAHVAVAKELRRLFELDIFVFIPAFHAPHKRRKAPTSALDRYAMLCLVTNDEPLFLVSKMEIEVPERPYSIQTLTQLKSELPDSEIFFTMGADSWMDIATWREWEELLLMTNHIVVGRPNIEISFEHVSKRVRRRIIDVRAEDDATIALPGDHGPHIYITDTVKLDVAASEIRRQIREGDASWREDVQKDVAKYIEKYQIYS
jgi:nicotinate-nucleotide adenylyltransferase